MATSVTWSSNQGYNRFRSTLSAAESVYDNSTTEVGDENLTHAVEGLRSCILADTNFLLFMISRNSGKAFDRLTTSHEGMEAVRLLMEALERAELTLALIGGSKQSTLVLADKIRSQTNGIREASSALRLIFEAQRIHLDVDQDKIVATSCQVAVKALALCFRDTPFRLQRENILANIKELTPHEDLKYQGRPNLIVLRHYAPSPGTPTEVHLAPYLGTVFDAARLWEVQMRRENPPINIFTRLIQEYTPESCPSDIISLLKCTVESGEVISNFQTRARENLSIIENRRIRIAVCGMSAHGKTTLMNALIGERALSIRDPRDMTLSPCWPLVIEHDNSSKERTLRIEVDHLRPLIRTLDEYIHDTMTSKSLECELVKRVRASGEGLEPGNELIFKNDDVIKILQDLGGLVLSYYKVPAEARRRNELNDNWPILRSALTSLPTESPNIEFVDLPGFDNINLDPAVAQAQWQRELERCDGGIIVFPCDGSVIGSEAFNIDMRLLGHFNSLKPKPWIAVATKAESCDESDRRSYEDAFGIASLLITHSLKPIPLTFCSPYNYLTVRQIKTLFVEQSPKRPPLEAIKAIKGGDMMLRSILGLGANYEQWSAVFAEGIDDALTQSNMLATVENIKANLIDPIIQIRRTTLVKSTVDQIDEIKVAHDIIISAAFNKKEDIDSAMSLCQDLQSEVASFCTSWSVTKVKHFVDAQEPIRKTIWEATEALQKILRDIMGEFIAKYAFGESNLTSRKTVKVAQEEVDSLYMRLLEITGSHQKKIVVEVVRLARVAWAKRLNELRNLFEDEEIIRRNGDLPSQLRQDIKHKIDALMQQSGNTVIHSYIDKIKSRVDSPQKGCSTIWSAINAAPESYTVEGDGGGVWAASPKVASPPKTLLALKGWLREETLRDEGLNAFGFLLVPAISVSDNFQRARVEHASLGHNLNADDISGLLQACIHHWTASINAQSYRTLYGSLNGITMIGIETILDAFGSCLTKLEDQMDIYGQAQLFQQKEELIDATIIAQVNATCAWAALKELLKNGM
ncbi:hypothetical protein FRC17_003577 [Serendipita sp. 399]|nr:hypothetical protein FRC17_003577 [Serendipita sp. 399]